MQRKSDLYVITKVKELTEYVITVTEKSPKKFRFTLVARLQNYCLDVVENLYLANSLCKRIVALPVLDGNEDSSPCCLPRRIVLVLPYSTRKLVEKRKVFE